MARKQPEFFKSETAVMEAAVTEYADKYRSRPVVAKAEEGFALCCKTTAKKNGWEILGRAYPRIRKAGEEATKEAKAETKTEAPKKLAAWDKPAKQGKKAQERKLALEEMLGESKPAARK